MDWLYFIFLMLAYAVIPVIPAILLRWKMQMLGFRIIAALAVIIGIACLIIIVSGGDAFIEDYEWLATFAQCALVSSVPALFCVAFYGMKGEIWITLVPSLLYLCAFALRYFMTYGVSQTMNYFSEIMNFFTTGKIGDEAIGIMMMMIMSVVFFVWALLFVIITKTIRKKIEKRKNERISQNKNIRRR